MVMVHTCWWWSSYKKLELEWQEGCARGQKQLANVADSVQKTTYLTGEHWGSLADCEQLQGRASSRVRGQIIDVARKGVIMLDCAGLMLRWAFGCAVMGFGASMLQSIAERSQWIGKWKYAGLFLLLLSSLTSLYAI
ncbi:hypothetical protein DD237_000553 [Peronospora effusa]|uniref:Uncharacterized protein n=1 Tax=Peronospora effusa TaxID=542832 RepID=A0A425CID1_9STRA|nr:hypothetical protein DD237_000553 [Peronospora effusa]